MATAPGSSHALRLWERGKLQYPGKQAMGRTAAPDGRH